MSFKYAVLGAGGTGVAAACDLAAHGDAAEILLADGDAAKAKEAAARAAKLSKGRKAKFKSAALELDKKGGLAKALKGADAVLSTLGPRHNLAAAQAAVAAKAHYDDTGSGLETAQAILKLRAPALKAGVSVVPDCGLAPGLSSCLVVAAIATLDFSRDARVFAGCLPQRPAGQFDYAAVCPLDSLLSLYLEPAVALRRGRIDSLAPMSDREELDIPSVGKLEACLTGGTGSTCPYSFQNRLVNFEQKTLRYPGHFDKMSAMLAMGFLSDKPVAIDGGRVAPRELFLALAEKARGRREEPDLVVLRVSVRGKKHGRATEAVYDVVDRLDPATGFSAAERATAFPASAALALQARGKVKPGAEPPEAALPHRDFVAEVRRRGLKISESLRALASA